MTLTAIYANLGCSDLRRSTGWYIDLFGRRPDATPMPGLAEWRHGDGAGLQLSEDAARAGKGAMTLVVADLRAERERLARLSPGEVEEGDEVLLVRLADPDGNLVVLAQPADT